MIRLIATILTTIPIAYAAQISRGYLDPGYPIKALGGKKILIVGLSKANANLDRLLRDKGDDEKKNRIADSILAGFNRDFARNLSQALRKAEIKTVLDADTPGFKFKKVYGDSALPDTLACIIPDSAYFQKLGFAPDVAIVIGKSVFGRRGQRVAGYAGDEGPDISFWYGAAEPGRTWKRKIVLSTTEFCFFDYHARKAIGYGVDIVETDVWLPGGGADPQGHFTKMARDLADLFLRNDAAQTDKYRDRELEFSKRVGEKANTKEVLEKDEDE